MKISELILEGKEIRQGLVQISGEPGYHPNDYGRFHKWIHLVERFLAVNFPDDECNREFNNAVAFYNLDYNPQFIDEMIGILTACENFPEHVPSLGSRNKKSSSNIETAIEDILRRELKGKDFDELKELLSRNRDLDDNEILEHIKSLGIDTLANILKQILSI